MKLSNPNHRHKLTSRSNPNRQKGPQNGSNRTRPASSTSNSKRQLNNHGQVKILKRREPAPDPKTARFHGSYAGSSMCVASPPPTSVPLPLFITEKIVAVSNATNDTRKMLRLEFS